MFVHAHTEASRAACASPKRRCSVKNLVDQVDTQPPLRPLAPLPQISASISTTSRSERACRASIAVHSPVKPPPTMQRPVRVFPIKGGAGGARSPLRASAIQNGRSSGVGTRLRGY